MTSRRFVVRGRVQGVGFRYFVEWHANRLQLAGWVRNLPTGVAVEVHAAGGDDAVRELGRLMREGPPGSLVHAIEETPLADDTPLPRPFRVRF